MYEYIHGIYAYYDSCSKSPRDYTIQNNLVKMLFFFNI